MIGSIKKFSKHMVQKHILNLNDSAVKIKDRIRFTFTKYFLENLLPTNF